MKILIGILLLVLGICILFFHTTPMFKKWGFKKEFFIGYWFQRVICIVAGLLCLFISCAILFEVVKI